MSNKDVNVICLVGMPGSGKGTCTDYLHDKYGWPVVHFGNMVYDEVQRRGLDNIRDEIFVREDMRAQEGKAVLAKHAARKANELFETGNKKVVFDGLYSWTEYRYLQEIYGDKLLIIAVAAPRKLRYERILKRNDSHRKYTSEQQIINREVAEIENLEKGGPIANADYTIVNDGDLATLTRRLESVLQDAKIM